MEKNQHNSISVTTEKDFPRFSDAKIQFEVTQPQMKLILCAVRAFRDQIGTKTFNQSLKTFLEDSERSYDFRFIKPYADNQKLLEFDVEQAIDALCDAYTAKRWEFREMVEQELNEFHQDNFDPEILNLTNGEIIKVDQNV